jgi:hypothetical protein
MIARLIQVVWEIGAVALIVGTILTVRKARARGKRLFADEPTARIKALGPDTRMDHRQDAS